MKTTTKITIGLSAFSLATFASAASDFSQLTSSIDFSSAGTAILAIGAAVAGALVVRKGARLVLGMLK